MNSVSVTRKPENAILINRNQRVEVHIKKKG